MNRGQNAVWAVLAAGATALVLFGVLIYMARSQSSNPDIILPPGPSDISVPTSDHGEQPDTDPFAPNEIDITPQNVMKIVSDLTRPTEYTAVNRTTRYWAEGSASTSFRVYVLGDCSRVDTLTDGSESSESYVIFTSSVVYMPLGGQDQPIERGAFTSDAAASMPTYEDVLSLSEKVIAGAGYTRKNSRPCVWVQTQDEYDIEYWIDLESGLLIAAEARQNGLQAWSFEQTELTLGAPDRELFLLPSGADALSVQEQQP